MSDAQVTRDGLEGVRPGREASLNGGEGGGRGVGAHRGGGERRRRRDGDQFSSYYGRPIINPPVWDERNIAGYLFAGGLAGASSMLAAGGELDAASAPRASLQAVRIGGARCVVRRTGA